MAGVRLSCVTLISGGPCQRGGGCRWPPARTRVKAATVWAPTQGPQDRSQRGRGSTTETTEASWAIGVWGELRPRRKTLRSLGSHWRRPFLPGGVGSGPRGPPSQGEPSTRGPADCGSEKRVHLVCAHMSIHIHVCWGGGVKSPRARSRDQLLFPPQRGWWAGPGGALGTPFRGTPCRCSLKGQLVWSPREKATDPERSSRTCSFRQRVSGEAPGQTLGHPGGTRRSLPKHILAASVYALASLQEA